MRRFLARHRPCRFLFLTFSLLLLAVSDSHAGAAAEAPRQAQGTIETEARKFEVFGAYAFPSEVGMDDEPGIKVAVSNAGFIAASLDSDYDREHMIDTYFRDNETMVAYFHFSKSGVYKGMTYYFGSGDGCGFCYDGSVQSTVKVSNGRIQGGVRLAGKPDELHFDLSFDVPVAPSDYGQPLPAGGGDPGKAYAALHPALVAWDNAAARPYFTDEDQAEFPEHADEILKSFRDQHPDKAFRIVRGFLRGDRALLLVEGETSYSRVKTEAQLVKEKGTWRLESETLQIRMGEE